MSGLVALGLLAGCETRPADPRNVPLRDVRTSSDARYVQCVARDPLFQTSECRQVRLETRAGNNR